MKNFEKQEREEKKIKEWRGMWKRNKMHSWANTEEIKHDTAFSAQSTQKIQNQQSWCKIKRAGCKI